MELKKQTGLLKQLLMKFLLGQQYGALLGHQLMTEKLVKGADWESTASTTAYGTIHPYVADGTITKTGDCFS